MKKLQKFKSRYLKILLLTCSMFLPYQAIAYDFENDGIYYTIISDTEAAVAANNTCSGDVVIPESVFDDYTNISYRVTSIDDSAFSYCKSLTSVSIPNSVTSIGNSAFEVCTSLTSISIPNSVTSIGNSAFYDCENLTSVSLPTSITSISDYTFGSCSSLTSICIPESVISIGEYAFDRCVSLKTIEFPNAVQTIGRYAFDGCKGLSEIQFPNSITSIDFGAFFECNGLESVFIPSSVNYIGCGAFACFNDAKIKSITVSEDNQQYASLNGLLFTKDLTTLVMVPCGLTSVEIPNSVNTIYDSAFWYCVGLTKIVIPNSVTKIDLQAFKNCENLIEIEIPNTVTSIGAGAFWGCNHLTKIEIPNTITSIAMYTFYACLDLPAIIIPDSVTSIGESAFVSCLALKEINIPASVTTIEKDAFLNCINVSKIDIGSSVSNIGEEAFKGNLHLSEIISHNPTPPSVCSNSFPSNAYASAKLTVPNGSVSSYKQADVWKDFENIESEKIYATDISLDITSTVIHVGEQLRITATVSPETTTDKTIEWSTSDENVATVSAEGVVTAVALGEAVITAKCGEATATCKVTVVATPAESVTLNCSDASLKKDETLQLTATVSPETTTDKTIEWSTSDENVATVSDEGVVTAIALGEAVITAKCGEATATCKVTVVPTLATSISLDETEKSVVVGDEFFLIATVLPDEATDKTVDWSSSNDNVATVDNSGYVKIVGEGRCVIKASTTDGSNLSAECELTAIQSGCEEIYLEGRKVSVYTLNGVVVLIDADPATLRTLDPGIYVVKVGDRIHKVVVK